MVLLYLTDRINEALRPTLQKTLKPGARIVSHRFRMGDWKLTFDSQGNGDLYDLAADPMELRNLFGDPGHADRQLALTTELLRWTIRTEDDLPGGRYVRKLPARNWYATGR